MNILDLFCGTGAFSYGVQRADESFELFGGIDVSENAIETFRSNHAKKDSENKNPIKCVDIRDYEPTDFASEFNIDKENVNVVTGGPPCQGFSSIRPGRSSDDADARNNLYVRYLSYIEYFEPDFFVMENVVGLVGHKNGETLDAIESYLREQQTLSEYSYSWWILNAANFGVPQQRHRFVLLASKSNDKIIPPKPSHYIESRSRDKIDSLATKAAEATEIKDEVAENVLVYLQKQGMLDYESDMGNYIDVVNFEIDEENHIRPKIERGESGELKPAVTVHEAIWDLPILTHQTNVEQYRFDPENEYQERMRQNSDKLTHHKSTKHSQSMLRYIVNQQGYVKSEIPEPYRPPSGYSTTYSRIREDHPSSTITTNFTTASAYRCIHPRQHRSLTPREGARLQSFPDWFTFHGNKTEVVSQIGNAVPPLLGEAIGNSIKLMNES